MKQTLRPKQRRGQLCKKRLEKERLNRMYQNEQNHIQEDAARKRYFPECAVPDQTTDRTESNMMQF